MAPFTDPTDSAIAELTDAARTEIARAYLGLVAYKFVGFAVGREGYLDSNPVKTDAITTADTDIGDQVYPPKYGADTLVVSHYNANIDLDHVRDNGSPTGTASGTVTIDTVNPKFGAGALALNDAAHCHVDYSGAGLVDALVQLGSISFWYRPGYAGAPATPQYILSIGNASGSLINGIQIIHQVGGNLDFQVYDALGNPVSSVSAAWAPAIDTYYLVTLDVDIAAGATRAWINGIQHGSTDTSTGNRDANAQLLRLGDSLVPQTLLNNFLVDELLIYDEVQHVAPFTPPTAEADPFSLADFADIEEPIPNTVAPLCKLDTEQGNYGLGELGIWCEITFDADTPGRVGDKFLYAIAHFPLHGKNDKGVSVWRITFLL